MKFYILFFLFAFSTVPTGAENSKAGLIIGKWYNMDKTEIIEITKTNNEYIGRVVWMQSPKDINGNLKLDKKNPNKTLKTQPILGSQNIFGLQNKKGKWVNGKIYYHKKGGTVKFDVITISETTLVIKISVGFFTKEITYTRVA